VKIVVMSWLARESVEIFLRSNIVYRPDLAARPAHVASDELALLAPDVVIARAADGEVVAALHALLPDCRFIVCRLASAEPARDLPQPGPRCAWVCASTWERAEYEAFVLAEALCRPRHRPRPPAIGEQPADVILVGAGVVNLVTALVLRTHGFDVSVVDRMADPLASEHERPRGAGATFGGRDARIFSFNESRQHLACSPRYTPQTHTQFRAKVSQDGWLSRAPEHLGARERQWIRQLEQVPPWAALAYGNDIVGFNRQSAARWQEIFSLHPEILQDAHYIGRLLRVYPDQGSFAAARTAEAEIGALIRTLDLQRLREDEPALADAIDRGAIAGALAVRGFSLNIQRFGRNLVRLLQALGVRFSWQQQLETIRHDGAGAVSGLVIGGQLCRARHYVICPGAHGRSIEGRSAALDAIGAMVGMWVTLPNDRMPLSSPLKVRRRGFGSGEAAQGANIVPARDASGAPVLHCSSGHGFVGVDAADVRAADLEELARCVMQTAEDLFGDKFHRARSSGLIGAAPEYCIRPWTPSGLGLLEVQDAASGGRLVVSGGHNTGGFAQSPEVAQAVLCALQERPHPMHALYHPRRFADVFEASA
jgi:D-amino-acid dehydrogenase